MSAEVMSAEQVGSGAMACCTSSIGPACQHRQVPTHLLPESCHVCGRPEAEHAGENRGYGQITGHTYWSNADAEREAREHDRHVTYSKEAAYVAQHRPY